MKKISLITILCFIFVLSFGVMSVYAESNEEVPTDTTLTELEEIDEYTANITKGIVVLVLGFFGTSAAAVAFRKQLKSLFSKVVTAIGLLKTTKDKNEEELDELKQDVKKTISSLKKTKDEIVNSTKEDINNLIKTNQLLVKALMCLASGTNELVINGTSESIKELLKEVDKETIENEG